jgi:hypothetical protein
MEEREGRPPGPVAHRNTSCHASSPSNASSCSSLPPIAFCAVTLAAAPSAALFSTGAIDHSGKRLHISASHACEQTPARHSVSHCSEVGPRTCPRGPPNIVTSMRVQQPLGRRRVFLAAPGWRRRSRQTRRASLHLPAGRPRAPCTALLRPAACDAPPADILEPLRPPSLPLRRSELPFTAWFQPPAEIGVQVLVLQGTSPSGHRCAGTRLRRHKLAATRHTAHARAVLYPPAAVLPLLPPLPLPSDPGWA